MAGRTRKCRQAPQEKGNSDEPPTKNKENSVVNAKKPAQAEKEKVFKTIGEILNDAQMSSKSHNLLVDKMKELFYSVKSNQAAALTHQTYCGSIIWRYLHAFFVTRGVFTDNVLRFVKKILLSLGLEQDVREFKFPFQDLTPLYIIILKFICQCHIDSRIIVRFRMMEMAKEILEEFHSHPTYLPRRSLKHNLVQTILHRCRDRHHSVRVQAVLCMQFFREVTDVRHMLPFCVRKDLNPEVRRTALKILSTIPGIKFSTFFEQVFDQSELVRITAFKCLANISLDKVTKVDQRRKILSWGLTHGTKKVQAVVKNELLPAWLKYSKNSLISLLGKLELCAKPHLMSPILKSIYKQDDDETLDQIDLTFLSPKKLIPIEIITLEKVQFWFLLCCKFRDQPSCAAKLLPEPIDLCTYALELVEAIHKERAAAAAEKRPEEYTLFLSLAMALRISEFIQFEEGSRRELERVVKQILLDPGLEECVIMSAGMDVAFNMIAKEDYRHFMTGIFEAVFEEAFPRDSFIQENEGGNPASAHSIAAEGTLRSEVDDGPVSPINPPGPNQANLNLTPHNTPLRNRRESFRLPFVTSTPFLNPAVARATYKFENLRKEQSQKTIERIRLVEARDWASHQRNSFEVKQINKRIDVVRAEEESLIRKLEDARHAADLGFITAQGTAAPLHSSPPPSPQQSLRNELPITPISRPQESPKSTPGSIEAEKTSPRMPACILKGLTILMRYLILHRKISPAIRELCNWSIMPCLEVDPDARVRAAIMQLQCILGILDSSQAHSALTLMYKGITLEMDKVVKMAAFRGLVDLLIEYDALTFRRPLEDPSDDRHPMPPPLCNRDATRKELETALTSFVTTFGGTDPSAKEVELRSVGIMKLLLRGRLTQEDIIADLFCLWLDPRYAFSSFCDQITFWLPNYTSIILDNSRRVAKALLISFQRIYDEQATKGARKGFAAKLIDFVLANISASVLEKFPDYHIVHEELALDILHGIDNDITKNGNAQLALIINELRIKTKKTVRAIQSKCAEIQERMSLVLTAIGVPSLKVAITNIVKNIENVDLPDEIEEVEDGDPEEVDVDIDEMINELDDEEIV